MKFTIQTIDPYFPVVLSIKLYKVILRFDSVNVTLQYYCHVVLVVFENS